MDGGVLKVGIPVYGWEDCEDGTQDGLEDVHGSTLLNVLPKLSQHEELHELKPHRGKMVQPSRNGE